MLTKSISVILPEIVNDAVVSSDYGIKNLALDVWSTGTADRKYYFERGASTGELRQFDKGTSMEEKPSIYPNRQGEELYNVEYFDVLE